MLTKNIVDILIVVILNGGILGALWFLNRLFNSKPHFDFWNSGLALYNLYQSEKIIDYVNEGDKISDMKKGDIERFLSHTFADTLLDMKISRWSYLKFILRYNPKHLIPRELEELHRFLDDKAYMDIDQDKVNNRAKHKNCTDCGKCKPEDKFIVAKWIYEVGYHNEKVRGIRG